MKLFKKIKKYFDNLKIQNKINNAKYIHLMFNDKFNKPYVDFLNDNFNQEEHIVLCKRWFKEHLFPEGANVFEIEKLKSFKFNKASKIICHSLFDVDLIEYLYEHQDILKNKSYWCIWGGDLYNAPRDEKNDFVRSNFRGYISVADGDEIVAKEKYNLKTKILVSAPYLSPSALNNNIYKKLIESPIQNNELRIQINNSCDESTTEMLDILSKFKDENIKITTILSYGKMEYKDEIIKKGKDIFGDKFEYIENYMPIEDFIKYSASNDILICNQNRQQGLGNILSSLYLGKKVFIKSDITSVKHLKKYGLEVFDTYKIQDLDFEEFKTYLKDLKQNNINEAEKFYTDDLYIEKWNTVFNL